MPDLPDSRPGGAGAAGGAPSPPSGPWRPRANPWLIGVVVALAAFMEVLDTSIANVALPYIAGSLGATNDQSTWVLTSYLAANAIVLPISGWFAGTFGRKRFFMICLMIFTVSSVLCGLAPSLGGDYPVSGSAGRRRRRAATHGAGHSGGYVPAGEARPGIRALRRHRRHCADDRADFGRLDHGQLQLALDLLHQRAGGRADAVADLPAGRRPAVGEARTRRGRQAGLYRHRPAQFGRRMSASDARQGTGRRLVRIALHSDARDWRRRRPDLAGDLGMVSRPPDHRRPPLQEPEFRGRQFHDVRTRNRAFFQPGPDPAVSANACWATRPNRPGWCFPAAACCCCF